MSRAAFAFLFLVACGGESSSTGTATGQQAATGTTSAAGSTPSSLTMPRSALQSLPAGADPWLAIPKAMSQVQGGAVADQISDRLEIR